MFNPINKKSVIPTLFTTLLILSPVALADTGQKAHQMIDIMLDSGGSPAKTVSGYSGPVIPSLQNALSDLERAEKTLMSIKPKLGQHKKRALNQLRNAIRSVKKSMQYAENNL